MQLYKQNLSQQITNTTQMIVFTMKLFNSNQ